MPTFTETSPPGLGRDHDMKFADKNCLDMSRCLQQSPWQVRYNPVCVALMELSQLQCTEKVGRGRKSRKSAAQIMKVGDMICVTDYRDLCLGAKSA